MIDHREQMRKINENTTPEQRKERAKKAHKKRSETLKKRKEMKETLEILMELELSDKNKKTLMNMGLTDEALQNNQTMLMASVFQQALKGNMRATEFIANILGENAEKKINVSGNVPVIIAGADKLED